MPKEIIQEKLDEAEEKFFSKYFDRRARYLEKAGRNVVLNEIYNSGHVSSDLLEELGAEHPCILAGYGHVKMLPRASENYPTQLNDVPIFYFECGISRAQKDKK